MNRNRSGLIRILVLALLASTVPSCVGNITVTSAGDGGILDPLVDGGSSADDDGATGGSRDGAAPAARDGAAPVARDDAGTIIDPTDAGEPPVGPPIDYTAGLPPLEGPAGEKPFDWVGIIGTGQSLSVGWDATAISTTQRYRNLKLQDDGPDPKYPVTDVASAVWRAVPLTEPIRQTVAGLPSNPYPNNIFLGNGESPHTGMGDQVAFIWGRKTSTDYVTTHTVVGVPGTGITGIAKGTNSYSASLNETRVFKKLATAAGKTFGVAAVVLTHGEEDATNNPNYGSAVYQLLKDYNAELKAITGQTSNVVLLASQQSAFSGSGNSSVQLWKQSVDHPGEIVVVGPKYQYGPYTLHMNAGSYSRLGEKYGEIFDLIVNQRVAWKPLQPNKVRRSGAILTIDFDVPNPPLSWDTRLPASHATINQAWSKGRGFEVKSSSGQELEIASVTIQGSSVILTLAQTPADNVSLVLSYGVYGSAEASAGQDQGPHGQLRDSDEMIGADFEKIEVNVAKGSADIGGTKERDFQRRAQRDVITGPNLPRDTIANSVMGNGITMSAPWTGESGRTTLTFHHDLHNYCVHFEVPVPYR